jgi:hypothetical protein
MLPSETIVPALQRVEEVLEDLDAVKWELRQILGNPELPLNLTGEAERKVDQAENTLSQVLPLVHQILSPFTEEQAALKAAHETIVHEGYLEKTEQQIPYLLNR